MSKKNIFILIGFIIIVTIISLLFIDLSKITEKPAPLKVGEEPKLEDCEEIAEIDPHCIAMVREDVNYCKNKPNQESIELCYDGSYMLFAI